MSVSRRLAAVTAGLFLTTSVASASVTYDLAQDWTTSNPNGAWAYLQGSIALPYWDSVGPLGGPAFAPGPNGGNFLPLYWQSNGPGTDIYIHSVDSSNGNPSNGEATLTWTAPAAGKIDISGYLYYAHPDYLGRRNDYTLDLGGQTLQSGVLGYDNASGRSNAIPVVFEDLAVSKGETLSLVLTHDPRNPSGWGTMTGLDLKIVETAPELPVWALLLVGFGGVGLGIRHRRGRAARCHLVDDI